VLVTKFVIHRELFLRLGHVAVRSSVVTTRPSTSDIERTKNDGIAGVGETGSEIEVDGEKKGELEDSFALTDSFALPGEYDRV